MGLVLPQGVSHACVLNEKRQNKLQMHCALIIASYLSGCHPWGLRSVCEQSAPVDL